MTSPTRSTTATTPRSTGRRGSSCASTSAAGPLERCRASRPGSRSSTSRPVRTPSSRTRSSRATRATPPRRHVTPPFQGAWCPAGGAKGDACATLHSAPPKPIDFKNLKLVCYKKLPDLGSFLFVYFLITMQ